MMKTQTCIIKSNLHNGHILSKSLVDNHDFSEFNLRRVPQSLLLLVTQVQEILIINITELCLANEEHCCFSWRPITVLLCEKGLQARKYLCGKRVGSLIPQTITRLVSQLFEIRRFIEEKVVDALPLSQAPISAGNSSRQYLKQITGITYPARRGCRNIGLSQIGPTLRIQCQTLSQFPVPGYNICDINGQ